MGPGQMVQMAFMGVATLFISNPLRPYVAEFSQLEGEGAGPPCIDRAGSRDG